MSHTTRPFGLTLVLLFLLAAPLVAWGGAGVNAAALAEIPILDQGRIKPLDTFARVQLLSVFGKRSMPNMSALEWLAELIFTPETAYARPVFRFRNPDLEAALSLTPNADHLYTFDAVSHALHRLGHTIDKLHQLPRESLTPVQRQMADLSIQMWRYYDVSRSLTGILPNFEITSSKVAKTLKLRTGTLYTYTEMLRARQGLATAAEGLEGKKPADLTTDEKALVHIAAQMQEMEGDGQSQFFRIVPPQWNESHDEWFSPWAVSRLGQGSVQSAAYLKLWRQLGTAYREADATAWNTAVAAIMAQSHQFPGVRPSILRLEHRYSIWALFMKSLSLYILGFLLLACSWLFLARPLRIAAVSALSAGALLHFIGIVLRIIIMGRPPVSTLYESIVFVGFIAMLFGLVVEYRQRSGLGTLIGTIAGAVLLFLARSYANDGDTMGQLVAVLNTNFWLATHVVTITIGYGCCLVGGVIGHVYMMMRAMRPDQTQRHLELYQSMLGVSLFALFFALFGTILGGIWADQSWGRFWGWDPKENGALLIVLWLLWVLHARMDGMIKPLGYAFSMIGLNIIVALAWFGVNLLNVGLHSYGFTESIAMNLFLFCTGEFLFGLIMYGVIRMRDAGFQITRQAS